MYHFSFHFRIYVALLIPCPKVPSILLLQRGTSRVLNGRCIAKGKGYKPSCAAIYVLGDWVNQEAVVKAGWSRPSLEWSYYSQQFVTNCVPQIVYSLLLKRKYSTIMLLSLFCLIDSSLDIAFIYYTERCLDLVFDKTQNLELLVYQRELWTAEWQV